MKINNFQGDLTDMSAKKETLPLSSLGILAPGLHGILESVLAVDNVKTEIGYV